MHAGFALTCCVQAPNSGPAPEVLEWLSPKAIARPSGPAVSIYDAENPPVFAATSSVGLQGKWEGGEPLRLGRGERRGERLLVWAVLPEGRPTWIEVRGRRWPVEIWPVFSKLPAIVGLPKPPTERRAAIDALLADPAAALPVTLAARIELARSYQRENDGPRARAAWAGLSAAAEAASIPSYVSYGLRSSAYVAYFVDRDFAGALALLDQAEASDRSSGFEAGHVRTRYLRGLVAQESGRFRDAARDFREAARAAELMGLDRDAAFNLKALGPLLQDQGLHAEALAAMEGVSRTFLRAPDPRDRVWYLNDLCWILVRGMAAGALPPASERIRRLSQEAIGIAEEIGAPEELTALHAHLAWLELLLGRRAEARREVSLARRSHTVSPGFASLFLLLLEARIDLDDGLPASAHDRARELEGRARAESKGPATELVWRALEVQALAADQLGRSKEAGELFLQALSVLDEASRRVGLLEARGPYFADRRSLLDNAVAHLLAHGETARAFEVSDRYLGSLYRQLERSAARERAAAGSVSHHAEVNRQLDGLRAQEARLEAELEWASPKKRRTHRLALKALHAELLLLGSSIEVEDQPEDRKSTDPLSKLQPDEALVLYVSGESGPTGFFVRRLRNRLEVQRIAGPSAVLPIARGLRHLYVLGGDVAEANQLAAQRDSEGRFLIEKMSVSYLPNSSALGRGREQVAEPRLPLIVADPAGDLPEARREGRALLSRFEGSTLIEGKEATKDKLLEALNGRSLFHFAGHGSLAGPWRAHLQLAADRLEALDILLAPRKVGLVVLSGCETGVAEVLGPTQAVALPELWWIAGARAVLSTNRKVGDAESRRFIEAFYDKGGKDRPVEAYREAALSLIREGDDSWQAFRVVGLL